MGTLTKLKLVNSKRNRKVSIAVHRRNKLIAKIEEQIELINAQKDGTLYAPKKLKTVVNKVTGERRTIESTKRVKEWYWTTDNGKINFSVRYGSKVIELAKGKNAVEVANTDELISTMYLIKEAVENGELDDVITQASDNLRAGFSK